MRYVHLTRRLQEDPEELRAAAERRLYRLDPLRTTSDGRWILSPVAARYRNPETVLASAPRWA